MLPDDGLIVHLHDAVGVTAAGAARQTGKRRGCQAEAAGRVQGGASQQAPHLLPELSVTSRNRQSRLRHPVLGGGPKALPTHPPLPKRVPSPPVQQGVVRDRQEPPPQLPALLLPLLREQRNNSHNSRRPASDTLPSRAQAAPYSLLSLCSSSCSCLDALPASASPLRAFLVPETGSKVSPGTPLPAPFPVGLPPFQYS